MNDDITFGEFQQAQPEPGRAPDCDPRWVVDWAGSTEDSFGVFVDLDVMRELESHARGNVSIELGGVLLGDQHVDDAGRPFVVVRDSLRAEHYEATRGSFKFTHRTWEAITRQLDAFPEKIGIVGWYHTHPGWGVFLSEMDLFICNHFFGRPLDVALVIDPLRDERGWFAWSQESEERTQRRLSRFGLFAHRHRREELEMVAHRYNESESMPTDPRLRVSSSTSSPSTITLVERAPSLAVWLAFAALLLGQLTLIAALIWRDASARTAVLPASNDAGLAEVAAREIQAQARVELLRELLIETVEKAPESAGLVDRFAALSVEIQSLRSNAEGQAALNRELKQQLGQSNEQVARLSLDQQRLTEVLARRDAQVEELQAKADAADGTAKDQPLATWMLIAIAAAIAFLAAVGGIVGGYWIAGARRESASDNSGSAGLDRSNASEDKIKLA